MEEAKCKKLEEDLFAQYKNAARGVDSASDLINVVCNEPSKVCKKRFQNASLPDESKEYLGGELVEAIKGFLDYVEQGKGKEHVEAFIKKISGVKIPNDIIVSKEINDAVKKMNETVKKLSIGEEFADNLEREIIAKIKPCITEVSKNLKNLRTNMNKLR